MLYWEFSIPRMGRRVDVVLVTPLAVFVLEFKVGASEFDRSAIEQVWDYALDLKNFHETSHHVPLIPVLIATEAPETSPIVLAAAHDRVFSPVRISPQQLPRLLDDVVRLRHNSIIEMDSWVDGSYRPTPTILEAARALYAQHSVEAIARSDASAKNLHVTSSRIEELIEQARQTHSKVIIFVTGVPGAGKTLVGLDVANRRREGETHAVYLSGNGPLVEVLQEALTRDECDRRKGRGEELKKGEVRTSVKAFIQNVHHFRDQALYDDKPPSDHVAIFDEAQRAWTLDQTIRFMAGKKGITGFDMSEPEFLISYMDRHEDWAVIVCLVGGGQEINTGEAGIDSWLEALENRFAYWDVFISGHLNDSEYASGRVATIVHRRPNVYSDARLHLAVSMRSFRAERVSGFVKALLDRDVDMARGHLSAFIARYPIAITRNLDTAKDWVRSRARGSERYGLVSTSRAARLKPHAVDARYKVNPVHWFLNDRNDTRSSYYLEDAATEYRVQGLELDWVCVAWDGDVRVSEHGWSYHDFHGDRWRYFLNAYRVLLTRARQGMVVFVPPGDPDDPTRPPEMYDPTFEYLQSLGLQEIG